MCIIIIYIVLRVSSLCDEDRNHTMRRRAVQEWIHWNIFLYNVTFLVLNFNVCLKYETRLYVLCYWDLCNDNNYTVRRWHRSHLIVVGLTNDDRSAAFVRIALHRRQLPVNRSDVNDKNRYLIKSRRFRYDATVHDSFPSAVIKSRGLLRPSDRTVVSPRGRWLNYNRNRTTVTAAAAAAGASVASARVFL